jgi:hypothetical protein
MIKDISVFDKTIGISSNKKGCENMFFLILSVIIGVSEDN